VTTVTYPAPMAGYPMFDLKGTLLIPEHHVKDIGTQVAGLEGRVMTILEAQDNDRTAIID